MVIEHAQTDLPMLALRVFTSNLDLQQRDVAHHLWVIIEFYNLCAATLNAKYLTVFVFFLDMTSVRTLFCDFNPYWMFLRISISDRYFDS